jgi:hypothetical protein
MTSAVPWWARDASYLTSSSRWRQVSRQSCSVRTQTLRIWVQAQWVAWSEKRCALANRSFGVWEEAIRSLKSAGEDGQSRRQLCGLCHAARERAAQRRVFSLDISSMSASSLKSAASCAMHLRFACVICDTLDGGDLDIYDDFFLGLAMSVRPTVCTRCHVGQLDFEHSTASCALNTSIQAGKLCTMRRRSREGSN